MSDRRLLVVGNGFDLAHGLKVTYNDMLNVLFSNNRPSWLTHQQHVKYTYNQLLVHFRKKHISPTWTGFENELMEIINFYKSSIPSGKITTKNSTNTIIPDQSLYSEYESLNKTNKLHATYQFDTLWSTLRQMLNDTIDYVDLYLQNIDYDSISIYPAKIYKKKYDYYLSFNYTDTYKKQIRKVTSIDPSCPAIYPFDTKKHFIHGLAGRRVNGTSQIVLGINSQLRQIDANDENTIHTLYFEKTVQRIQKQTNIYYRKWFSNGGADKIYTDIFGHSLSLPDKDVILFLIEHSEQTKIYYYNQQDYEQKIINLIKLYESTEKFEEKYYDNKIIFEKST